MEQVCAFLEFQHQLHSWSDLRRGRRTLHKTEGQHVLTWPKGEVFALPQGGQAEMHLLACGSGHLSDRKGGVRRLKLTKWREGRLADIRLPKFANANVLAL
ncbi:MAG: hypothetical protein ACKERF_01390 [Candidatus Hodgkinia cicadicola]